MPSPSESDAIVEARRALGRQLAALRQAAGYSQQAFAPLTGYTRSTLGNVETGRQNVPRQFWERCRDKLGAPELIAGYEQVKAIAEVGKRTAAACAEADRRARIATWHSSQEPLLSPLDAGGVTRTLMPGVQQSPALPGCDVDWYLTFPSGRLLDNGAHVAVQVHQVSASRDGTLFLPSRDPRLSQIAGTTQRAMIFGIDQQADAPKLHAVDVRYIRSELGRAIRRQSPISMPREYEIDDLSYAIIWAVTLLDDALLADDQALDERRRWLNGCGEQSQSGVGRESAADLTTAARLWPGSAFCSRHILRNLRLSGGMPVFWTQEQTGEEACMWLLFRHKLDYLRRISDAYNAASTPLSRGFCIPQTLTLASPRWERVLFFLAAALMESLGIRVLICAEPDYAEAEGFVLLPGSQAIIVTWIHADGIWQAGLASQSTTVRRLAEVSGHAAAHSVVDDPEPRRRLQALAEYLALDWPWLSNRCLALGRKGCGGLIRPRSRLLSTEGVDAALRFTGDLTRNEPARSTSA
jgi:transcriptional regulator with XRE-family HTH domain